MTPSPFARLDGLAFRGMKLGLEPIRQVLARLGNPERASPHVLIGGTNGKGSTAATLSSIFRSAGILAGLHTSPHLIDVTERVRIGDRDVSPGTLGDALEAVFAAASPAPEIPLTYFEAIAAAAEWAFRNTECRAAIVEVGLGGRLDATNAAEPVLSAVTSIDFDHMADLGDTLEAIAREKAGIFRAGRPALVAARAAVAGVLRGEAERVGAEFVDIGSRARVSERREDDAGQSFVLETPSARYPIRTPLRGEHQASNVAVAVTAAELLRGGFPALTEAAILSGVASTRWPGRLERFRVGSKIVWLDGCHNPEGARALARFLAGRGARADLLFGAMRDKDAPAIAGPLFSAVRRIVLAVPDTDRAATHGELERSLGSLAERAERAASPREGLETLLGGPSGEIVVAGSLYLVGEVRQALLERQDGRAIA